MIAWTKVLTHLEWNSEFFEKLTSSETLYVSGEFEYSNTKKIQTGDIIEAKFHKQYGGYKFYAICSNYWRTIRRGSYRSYTKYRIVYRLTDAGLEYLKGLAVEQQV